MWGAVKAQMQSPPSQLNKKVPAHASGPQSHVQITHRSFTLVSAENYHVKKRKREKKNIRNHPQISTAHSPSNWKGKGRVL
jgi:hypothetical protein